MEKNWKYIVSFGLSLAICSVINALLVVAKEKSHAVQAEMQKLTGSHWVTHAGIVIILFVLCGWMLARGGNGRGVTMAANRLIKIIIAGVFSAGLIIVGFYLLGD